MSNLEWVTYAENSQHGRDAGLIKNVTQRAFSDTQVKEIRELAKKGLHSQREIGEMYGSGKSAIQTLLQGRSYKDVE